MTKVGELFVEIKSNLKGFTKDMRGAKQEAKDAGAQMERSFSGASRKVDNFNAGLQRTSRLFRLAAGAATAGAVAGIVQKFGTSDIGASFARSDAALESQNAVNAARESTEQVKNSQKTTIEQIIAAGQLRAAGIRRAGSDLARKRCEELTSGLKADTIVGAGLLAGARNSNIPFLKRGLDILSGVSKNERSIEEQTGVTVQEQRIRQGQSLADQQTRALLAENERQTAAEIEAATNRINPQFQAERATREFDQLISAMNNLSDSLRNPAVPIGLQAGPGQ